MTDPTSILTLILCTPILAWGTYRFLVPRDAGLFSKALVGSVIAYVSGHFVLYVAGMGL